MLGGIGGRRRRGRQRMDGITDGNLLYGSGNSNRGSVSNQRGGRGREMRRSFKREGIYVYLWLIHVEI